MGGESEQNGYNHGARTSNTLFRNQKGVVIKILMEMAVGVHVQTEMNPVAIVGEAVNVIEGGSVIGLGVEIGPEVEIGNKVGTTVDTHQEKGITAKIEVAKKTDLPAEIVHPVEAVDHPAETTTMNIPQVMIAKIDHQVETEVGNQIGIVMMGDGRMISSNGKDRERKRRRNDLMAEEDRKRSSERHWNQYRRWQQKSQTKTALKRYHLQQVPIQYR